MKNETLGKRIYCRRKSLQLTQKQLAEQVNVSHVAISQWEKDETLPRGENLLRLAEALGCAPAFLIDGEGPVFTSAPVIAGFHSVPLISRTQLDQWLGEKKAHIDEILHTSLALSDEAFALRIEDHAMTPAYCSQDVVIIDPQIKPLPGDAVLALQQDEALIRTYRPRERHEGMTQFELAAVNIDYPLLHSRLDNLSLIGTVLELRRYRQR
ncbi:helix-turn-helix domain-containing protein [Pantoea sp. LMR881]|uniref:helix-turn-helix domain-containing protein n=1 Tax=Pantoea sp. LMR881 TaxID=3014336 RepID=UPI0022B06030|nr:helix-turn-helix domain-containing protein [Pantoea sp. LMR881]MCZ4058135.1 helix-turn-helix domain-containing protein [Pantoea sp. LMR881]